MSNVIRSRYLYFEECGDYIISLIDKFGIRAINSEASYIPGDGDKGTIRFNDNYFQYRLPYYSDIANFIGKRNLDKYNFRYHDSDDGILFSVRHYENILPLKNPEEKIGRARRKYLALYTDYKVPVIGFGGAYSYVNVDKGLKMIKKLIIHVDTKAEAEKYNI